MELIIREFNKPWVLEVILGKDKNECFTKLLHLDNEFGKKFTSALSNEQSWQERSKLLDKVATDNKWIYRWVY